MPTVYTLMCLWFSWLNLKWSCDFQVLTSKSCSEEGLEDATALLLHLSHGPPPARDLVLKLLLEGAYTLGETVTAHIGSLLSELQDYNSKNPHTEEESAMQLAEKTKKGVLVDRLVSIIIGLFSGISSFDNWVTVLLSR